MWKKFVALSLGIFVTAGAWADTVTGTIRTLNVDLASNRAYVQMDGAPNFNGGGCSVYWTANDLSDQNFMKYIWPLLLVAKASGSSVSITVSGCTGAFPRIVAAESEPRLVN